MRIAFKSAAVVSLLGVFAAQAFVHAQIGSVIEDVELPVLGGAKQRLFVGSNVTVFVFFKPGQEHSRATLQQVSAVARETAGKPVRWVTIVSDRFAPAEVEAAIKQSGLEAPVLVDVGDAFYGKLGVILSPVTGVIDREHRLAAYVPFTKVNYPVILRAHIRQLLGEITAAELAQALDPPSSARGGDAELARRQLRLAEKQFQAGNRNQARQHAEISLEKDPNLAAAYVLLGRVHEAQTNRAEALAAFEQALRLEPTNAAALAGQRACLAEPK